MKFFALFFSVFLVNYVTAELTQEDVDAKTEALMADLQQMQEEGKVGEACGDDKPCPEGQTCTGGLFPTCQALDCVEQAMHNTLINYPYRSMEDYSDYILAEVGLSSPEDAFESGGWFSFPKIKPEVEEAIIQAINENPLPLGEYRKQLKENCGSEQPSEEGTTVGGGVILKSSQIFKISYSWYTAQGDGDSAIASFSDICYGGGLEFGLKFAGIIVTLFSGTKNDFIGNSLMFNIDITPGIGYGTSFGCMDGTGVTKLQNEIGVGILGGAGVSWCTTTKIADNTFAPSFAPTPAPSASPSILVPTISNAPSATPTNQPTPDPTTVIDTIIPDTCFSDNNEVHVEGQGSVSIRHLELGDRVLGKDHKFQSIYAFGHRQDNDDLAEFLVVHTDKSPLPALELTPSHMLFLSGDQSNPVLARDLRVGDVLQHRDAEGNASLITVTQIESVARTGAFLPLTPDGTVVVNGVQVSVYASVPHAEEVLSWLSPILSPHTIFHWWLAPLRMVCTSSLFPRDAAICQAYDDDGLLVWLDFGNQLAKYLSQCHFILQSILVLSVLLVLSFMRLLEVAFGPTFGWVVLCGLVPLFVVRKSFTNEMSKA